MALLRHVRARRALSWVGANVVFVLCHPSAGFSLPPLVSAAGVALALLVLPGVAWSTVWPVTTRRLGARLGAVLACATVIFFVVLAGFALVGVPPSTPGLWSTLWIVTNVGFAAGVFSRRPPAGRRSYLPREIVIGVVCGVLAFAFFFWGATRVVPPLHDQDLEVSATGYGLVTAAVPLLLNDRLSVHFFAHPPLLHVYVAGAHILGGAVDDLRFYYDSSRRVLENWRDAVVPQRDGPVVVTGHPAPLPVPPGDYQVVGATGTEYLLASDAGGPPVPVAIYSLELDQIYAYYRNHPRLIEARTVNVFLAAVTAALLAVWMGRITRRAWLGVLLAATYATSPEVFVRSSYGGYFAIGALACVLILLAHEYWRRTGATWLPVLVGVFAALVDHKLVVLPFVLGALAMVRPHDRRQGWRARVHPIALGFVAGTALFWLWGLAVAPASFISDHLRGHLLDRVLHRNPFGYEGYPTVMGLWREFNSHTGHVLVPAALVFLAVDWWRARASRMATHTPPWGVWVLWMIVTAVVFSVIDWRMTKHLVLLVVPLVLALAPPRAASRWRVFASVAVVVALLAFNIHTVVGLADNFQSVVVTPLW
jgi:hypothetical protein